MRTDESRQRAEVAMARAWACSAASMARHSILGPFQKTTALFGGWRAQNRLDAIMNGVECVAGQSLVGRNKRSAMRLGGLLRQATHQSGPLRVQNRQPVPSITPIEVIALPLRDESLVALVSVRKTGTRHLQPDISLETLQIHLIQSFSCSTKIRWSPVRGCLRSTLQTGDLQLIGCFKPHFWTLVMVSVAEPRH